MANGRAQPRPAPGCIGAQLDLTAGDPDLATTAALCRMLEEEGADVIELGVPFTDPIADGPTNQRAAQRALDRGVRPDGILRMVRELREGGFALPTDGQAPHLGAIDYGSEERFGPKPGSAARGRRDGVG